MKRMTGIILLIVLLIVGLPAQAKMKKWKKVVLGVAVVSAPVVVGLLAAHPWNRKVKHACHADGRLESRPCRAGDI